MGNQTPETIRTAAYLAARERLDARKTTRNVQCNPPNIRCGNRCIPPTWDCRLKGQGTDPHLRAVKTDPLGGLANIQRGFGRISRGVVKGNFSVVEEALPVTWSMLVGCGTTAGGCCCGGGWPAIGGGSRGWSPYWGANWLEYCCWNCCTYGE